MENIILVTVVDTVSYLSFYSKHIHSRSLSNPINPSDVISSAILEVILHSGKTVLARIIRLIYLNLKINIFLAIVLRNEIWFDANVVAFECRDHRFPVMTDLGYPSWQIPVSPESKRWHHGNYRVSVHCSPRRPTNLLCVVIRNSSVEKFRSLNTLRPRQDGRLFRDDIFKCIFLYENAWIFIDISLEFVPKVRINNIPALVQIMAWRRSGDKPLSDPMIVSLPTHICVTRPQWDNIWARHRRFASFDGFYIA